MNFMLGADPELFVKNGKDFVSAHDLIPGNKVEPFKVEYGAVQVDGTAAEFNIEATREKDVFIRNITSVKSTLSSMIKEKNNNFEIVAEPVAQYKKEYFETLPPKARELGCDPDYNAYTYGSPNPIPNNEATFRTGSGHVHIGWTSGANVTDANYISFCCRLVRRLDVYLGLPSLLWDKDTKRRRLYGKAGAFRPKPYGLEYRVLSNKWLDDPELIAWVFDATQVCLNDELNQNDSTYNSVISNYNVPIIINKSDYNKLKDAASIKKFINKTLPKLPKKYLTDIKTTELESLLNDEF